MRKLFGFLTTGIVVLIPMFVFAGALDDASHPIFSEKNWILEKSQEHYAIDFDDTLVVYSVSRIYRQPEHKEYYLQENIVFGEAVVRIYTLEDNKKKLFETAFRLEKDGAWHGGGFVMWPFLTKDSLGKIVGARVVMVKWVNEKLKIIMTREVKRK